MSPCTGTGYYIEEYDVYACPTCGDIAETDNLYELSNGGTLLAGGDEEDFVRVVGQTLLDDVLVGRMAIIKQPYAAKDDLKELPFRQSERQWSEEVNHWAILDSWRERFVAHMKDAGWKTIDFVALQD